MTNPNPRASPFPHPRRNGRQRGRMTGLSRRRSERHMVGQAVDWRTDGDGFLLGAPHHDGVLVGFSYAQNRRLALCIRATDGRISHVRLLGLRNMNLIQVCTGTIILDLMAWRLSEVPETLWRRDGGAWGVLSDPQVRVAGSARNGRADPAGESGRIPVRADELLWRQAGGGL